MSTQTMGDGLDNDCDGLIDEENCEVSNNFAGKIHVLTLFN